MTVSTARSPYAQDLKFFTSIQWNEVSFLLYPVTSCFLHDKM